MVRKAYANAKIYDGDFTNAEFAERIAQAAAGRAAGHALGLRSFDRHSGPHHRNRRGKSLLQFEKERLLDPLGMSNTSFYVTDPAEEDADRQADAERP